MARSPPGSANSTGGKRISSVSRYTGMGYPDGDVVFFNSRNGFPSLAQAAEKHLVHKDPLDLFLDKTGDFPRPELRGITPAGKPGIAFVADRQKHLFPDKLCRKFGNRLFDDSQNNFIVQGIEIDDGIQAVAEFRGKGALQG